MTDINFAAILDQQVGSAPEPRPLPQGTYIGTISELPKAQSRQTKEGPTGVVTVTIALTEPTDDVDADDLEAAGGIRLGNGEPKKLRIDYWKDRNAETGWSYQLDNFLKGLGLEGSYAEALEAAIGREVMVVVEKRDYQAKDGQTRTVNDVKRVYANN